MSWKETLQTNVNNIEDIHPYVHISKKDIDAYKEITEHFPISSTTYYLNLIDPNDPDDPISKMAIPSVHEFDLDGDFDTSGESQNTKMKGLQHKYASTVLLLSTNRCAMYCRHCFRKRLVGTSTNETLGFIANAISYIKEHQEITNVLITGGDSFMLENNIIEIYLKALTQIDHIQFIRFGTRIPVVFPERIYSDDEFLGILNKYSKLKRIYVVTQFNHPREITPSSIKAINRLAENNILANNQTVLLKGVNDNPNTLAELQNKLAEIGVIPYYIFQCRPVKGVKNQFQLPLKEALEIVESAKSKMSGPAKRFKFCMSHETGKIEIIGTLHDKMIFKYHQAKNPNKYGKIFISDILEDQAWLDREDIQLDYRPLILENS